MWHELATGEESSKIQIPNSREARNFKLSNLEHPESDRRILKLIFGADSRR